MDGWMDGGSDDCSLAALVVVVVDLYDREQDPRITNA